MWVRLCLLSLHSVIIHFMARNRRRFSVRGMGTWEDNRVKTLLDTKTRLVFGFQINADVKELMAVIKNFAVNQSKEHWSALPDKIFHLSVCWPAQQQVYNSPELGERPCRGYIRSLPSSPLELYGIFPPVSSLCSPVSVKRGIATIDLEYCIIKPTANLVTLNVFVKVCTFLLVSWSLWPESCFHVSSSCWWIYWKAKKKKKKTQSRDTNSFD